MAAIPGQLLPAAILATFESLARQVKIFLLPVLFLIKEAHRSLRADDGKQRKPERKHCSGKLQPKTGVLPVAISRIWPPMPFGNCHINSPVIPSGAIQRSVVGLAR